jgi:hypothetical protein
MNRGRIMTRALPLLIVIGLFLSAMETWPARSRYSCRRRCWRGFIAHNDIVVSLNSMIEMDLTGAYSCEYLKEHQYDVSG